LENSSLGCAIIVDVAAIRSDEDLAKKHIAAGALAVLLLLKMHVNVSGSKVYLAYSEQDLVAEEVRPSILW